MQIIHRVVLQLILLLGLSWASGYVISDFSDSNWSTALFLTPSGLIENFARANTLMSFYFDPARTQGQPDIGSLVLWIALAVNARAIFKRIIR